MSFPNLYSPELIAAESLAKTIGNILHWASDPEKEPVSDGWADAMRNDTVGINGVGGPIATLEHGFGELTEAEVELARKDIIDHIERMRKSARLSTTPIEEWRVQADIDRYDRISAFQAKLNVAICKAESRDVTVEKPEATMLALGGEPPSPPEPPSEFAELLKFAEKNAIKGNERLALELICKNGGTLPIKDIAIEESINWPEPYDDSWKSLQGRVNKKIKPQGWKLSRRNNKAVLIRINKSRTKKS
jgi:hypothetical protein